MADNFYTGTGGDWDAAGDWSGGVPDNTDTVKILDLDESIALATDLPAATAGINYVGLETGPRVRGTIGTQGTPLYLGTVPSIIIDSPLSPGIHLAVDTGDACVLTILGCPQVLTIAGAGTWTTIYGQAGAGTLNIGATTVTTAWNLNGMRMVFASTATLATLYQLGAGAMADVYCATGTLLESHGGLAQLLGTTDQTHALLKIWGGRVYHNGTASPTITSFFVGRGGVLDLSGGTGKPITATGTGFPGGRVIKPANESRLTLTYTGKGGELTTSPSGGYGSA